MLDKKNKPKRINLLPILPCFSFFPFVDVIRNALAHIFFCGVTCENESMHDVDGRVAKQIVLDL